MNEDKLAPFMTRSIKELLGDYPQLGDILNEYEIGCVTCTVGTCMMQDIIKFHYLTPDQMQGLMSKMGSILAPETGTEPAEAQPAIEKHKGPKEIEYSLPMMDLVKEHALIKRLLALVPRLVDSVDLESEDDRQLVRDAVDFIRSYADRFHHAKEEDVLFKHFDAGEGVIQVMLQDHTHGREHVRAALDAVEKRDKQALKEHLMAYRDLLTEHIKKEDEILYPWMDRQFTPEQMNQLKQEFAQTDSTFGSAFGDDYHRLVERLEDAIDSRS